MFFFLPIYSILSAMSKTDDATRVSRVRSKLDVYVSQVFLTQALKYA